MKKGVLACFLICTFFLTGCGNKLTCTMNTTDEGRKTITTIDVDFKDDNVSEVNEKIVITFDDNYTDTIETLYNTINETVKTARMAEVAIVYGNRYRVTNREVDFNLIKAENNFLKGNFKSSLENAINAINIVEPGIYKRLLEEYK